MKCIQYQRTGPKIQMLYCRIRRLFKEHCKHGGERGGGSGGSDGVCFSNWLP